jgi:hypothetical protein
VLFSLENHSLHHHRTASRWFSYRKLFPQTRNVKEDEIKVEITFRLIAQMRGEI